jgi:GDP/UDP-N,N'-diacetylbacillosamine 2-epimerase (hydrolysing)
VLAATIAAAATQIPIAHIHGGDIADDKQIDGQIRHAITKFAHLHFTATKASSRRVLQMGEEDWRVFHVGGIGMDLVFAEELYSKKELLKILALNQIVPKENLILCVQHPAISEIENNGKYMKQIIQILKKLGDHAVIVYPNNDPGSDLIIAEIERNKDEERFHIFKTLPRKVFLSLMKHAKLMIGNSSSGIIESAVFNLPVINIGVRNLNRECSENVIFVENGMENIWAGIQTVFSEKFQNDLKKIENVYGNGNVSGKIVQILESFINNKHLIDKKFVSRDFC